MCGECVANVSQKCEHIPVTLWLCGQRSAWFKIRAWRNV